ncbi:hypothetical protein HG826_15130 [Streptomyces sp. GMY01]|uniref:hypothetical protein n=1 Tax=Streptomyces sp. GMY02 TaxID=1333528 RepID=UPI00146B4406|nr:hypothetical protein [Streptomyces sp. GMY02]NMO34878.1 hypothetical protein [Streptomyces sp. GMY02]
MIDVIDVIGALDVIGVIGVIGVSATAPRRELPVRQGSVHRTPAENRSVPGCADRPKDMCSKRGRRRWTR